MRPGPGFDPKPFEGSAWRAVEAQHVAATMMLVDSLEEQRVLEHLLDQAKPRLPEGVRHLHYLLATPFRYPPPPGGSRFRGPRDPGVFYCATAVRTACAELGFWRWKFLEASGLVSIPPAPHTLFRVRLQGAAIDLRVAPFSSRGRRWTHPTDYAPCQALAREARASRVELIRYQSVRDPEQGAAIAVLAPSAFAEPAPVTAETWYLGVNRTAVWWVRDHSHGPDQMLRFEMRRWRSSA
ncbi:MAG: RES domain-containing protein [Gemmatimonadetes bacterium]|nr:RES domain-containing protein [Gemmatimonadota bacterium]